MTQILKISDGTTTIDLLNMSGYYVHSWRPAIAKYKGGGVYSDSDLAENKQLVHRVFDNVEEKIVITVIGVDQPAVIEQLQQLVRLLEQAADYWTRDRVNPVWLERKVDEAVNSEYAIIVKADLDGLSDPFIETFGVGMARQQTLGKGMADLTLTIEREHWGARPPLASDDVGARYIPASTNLVSFWSDIGFSDIIETSTIAHSVLYMTEDENYAFHFSSGDNVGGTGNVMSRKDLTAPLGSGVTLQYSKEFSRATRFFEWGGAIYAIEINVFYPIVGSYDTPTLWRSTNLGDSWSVVAGITYEDIMIKNGVAYAVDMNGFYQSTNLTDWTTISTDVFGRTLHIMDNGDIYIARTGVIYLSEDGGTTWNLDYSFGAYESWQFTEVANDLWLSVQSYSNIPDFGGTLSTLMLHKPEGEDWFVYDHKNINGVAYRNGILIGAADDGSVYMSQNKGDSWIPLRGVNTANFEAVDSVLVTPANASLDFESSFGFVVAYSAVSDDTASGGLGGDGISGTILRKYTTPDTNYNVVANHCGDTLGVGDIESAWVYNASAELGGGEGLTVLPLELDYTAPTSIFPTNLTPNPIGNGDILLLASSTPFYNIRFFLESIMRADQVGVYWRYWNGSTWESMGTPAPLRDSGLNIARWDASLVAGWTPIDAGDLNSYPGEWANDNSYIWNLLDGLYVITIVFDDMQVVREIPTQVGNVVYSVNGQNLLLNETLEGDLPALGRIKYRQYLGSINRIVCGLKTSSTFNAFVPLFQEGQLAYRDLSITWGNKVNLADGVGGNPADPGIYSYGGAWCAYSNSGTHGFENQLTATATDCSEYIGSFRAFLRIYQPDYNVEEPGAVLLRLTTTVGAGLVVSQGPTINVKSAQAYEVLDMGAITVNSSGNELADTLNFVVEIQSTVPSPPTTYFLDLVLIPTNEWGGEFEDKVNNANSTIDSNRTLDITSIDPKNKIVAYLRSSNRQDRYSLFYRSIANNKISFSVGQRLWSLFMQTSAVGSDYVWTANPTILAGVQVEKQERFLTMRG